MPPLRSGKAMADSHATLVTSRVVPALGRFAPKPQPPGLTGETFVRSRAPGSATRPPKSRISQLHDLEQLAVVMQGVLRGVRDTMGRQVLGRRQRRLHHSQDQSARFSH